MMSAALFGLVATATVWMSLGGLSRRTRLLDRLASKAAVKPAATSPALVWRELVNRIGAAVPGSPKDLPRLKRRLIRAGFRNPGAPRFFHGIRAVLTVVLGLLGMAVA